MLTETLGGPMLEIFAAAAVVCGIIGFIGFVGAGIILVVESRLAMHALLRESEEAAAKLEKAVKQSGA